MARTRLVKQDIVLTGLVAVPVAADAANNHDFLNTGNQYLEIINASASPVVATVLTPATVGGLAVAENIVSVAAGATAKIGPFPPAIFSQSGGLVFLDLDVDTTITLSLIEF